MEPLAILNDIRIAAPCPASWADMKGDDRVRFCASCEKHVYNLAEMTPVEAVGLIERLEGNLCVRLYRRRDGTVLTADCPVGLRARAMARVRRVAVGGLVGLTLLLGGAFARVRGASGSGWQIDPPPTGPGVTLRDWRDWALESIGWLPKRGGMVAGGMIPLPPPMLSTPANGPAGGGPTCPIPPVPGPEDPAEAP